MKGVIVFLVSWTLALETGLAQNLSHIMPREKRELLIRSKRRWVLSTIDIEEESEGPYPAKATELFNDKKVFDHHYFRIGGMGVDKPPMGVFTIDPKTGVVFVHKAIDREQHDFFHIHFDVIDENTNEAVDKTLAFDVKIKDINDNAPRFEPANIKVSVKENIQQGGLPANLQVFDSDEENTENSRVTMRIVSQEPAFPKFNLQPVPNTKMEQLAFTGCFDYDKHKEYKVVIEARDYGTPPLSTTTTITVDITDANTHQPVFTETKYAVSVPEMEIKEILRLKVTDGDEPNTPASRPVYKILKGNDDGNYMIETDPKTNEGVLKVVKGKDFERTALLKLELAVENEEPLFECKDWVPVDADQKQSPQTVTVDVQVVDVNDPPVFERTAERAFEKEEVPPGKVLYTPKVTDEDSDVNKIRYVLVDDHAQWLDIDEKTGTVKSVKQMDRESYYVHDSIYTVKILAIDDGSPPATGTSTLYISLGDINDNKPHLVSKNTILCSNKEKVPVMAKDYDIPPYGAPFSFAFGGENPEELKKTWKIFPTSGVNTSLFSLTNLAYGNYTIPLLMEDQQGEEGEDELIVTVCDCAGGDTCRGPLPVTTQLDGRGIGALIAGLLLLLLLLLCIHCLCQGREFKPLAVQDEGHQTLIKYNEEGGGTACKAEPTMTRSPTTYVTTMAVTDGLKQAAVPLSQVSSNTFQMETQENSRMLQSHAQGMQSMNGFQQVSQASHTLRSTGRSRQTWNRNSTMRSGFSRSISYSDRYIGDHIDRKVYAIDEEVLDHPGCPLHEYAYEGNGSKCQSLDELSFDDLEENMDFLQNLGPNFNALGGICQRHMEEKH